MKKLTVLIGLLIFSFLLSKAQEISYTSTVEIGSQSTINKNDREHDLTVFNDEGKYVIQFNIKHGRKIQTHKAIVVSDKHFGKASYTWVSKNKVAIKLFSMSSSDEFKLKVWSESKRSTSMEVETEDISKS
jgi:hypothetical protein